VGADDTSAKAGGRADAPSPLGTRTGPQADLTGIIERPGETPQFNVDLLHADGTSQRVTVELGGTVWSDWIIGEFNPDERTVTLERDGEILILRRGVPLTL
jgi:hypothetical protein